MMNRRLAAFAISFMVLLGSSACGRNKKTKVTSLSEAAEEMDSEICKDMDSFYQQLYVVEAKAMMGKSSGTFGICCTMDKAAMDKFSEENMHYFESEGIDPDEMESITIYYSVRRDKDGNTQTLQASEYVFSDEDAAKEYFSGVKTSSEIMEDYLQKAEEAGRKAYSEENPDHVADRSEEPDETDSEITTNKTKPKTGKDGLSYRVVSMSRSDAPSKVYLEEGVYQKGASVIKLTQDLDWQGKKAPKDKQINELCDLLDFPRPEDEE